MRLVDLTRPLDPADLQRIPEPYRGWSGNLVPDIEPIHPWGEGAKVMCTVFGCEREHLPNGEGWGDERLKMTSHLGTHVDAPLHYGSTSEGRPARTISDIRLEELFVEAVVLDLRGAPSGQGISVEALDAAIDKLGAPVPEGGAVLIRTGQEAFPISDPRFFSYPGMTRQGTLFLAEKGAKVLGTDALGWDRPFQVMREAFRASGDPAEIWDGHFAGREREVLIVQQMVGLADLPSHGFKVGFFPLRLVGCSAAPARVIAFVED